MTSQNQLGGPDSIIYNAKIATLDSGNAMRQAIAISGGKVVATGDNSEILKLLGAKTTLINAGWRTVIPGLNDSHIHLIRGGLNFNMELRWDGVPSLADAMRMLKEQVRRTPPPQWVRVVGGWTEQQFAERRSPTLEEINAIAPDTPVFLLHLYDRALLNKAALRAVGYTKQTPNPPGAEIQRDHQGNPTGMLIARPNASLLYSALNAGPKLNRDDQFNSTRQFMYELNRLGITSISDAGGGFQNFPEDYQVIEELHRRGEMTVRIAYNLFTQKPHAELEDFRLWTASRKYTQGDHFYRLNGAGEMLVFSAADFEDFLEPRSQIAPTMEADLEPVVRVLAQNGWPFRLHATYDETITHALNVFEKVNREIPFNGLHWFFDHAETVGDQNLERIAALGGGIAIQDRMAFQGEYFVDRYGAKAAERTPPVRRMLEVGLPVGAGTDATRVSSYNPFVALHWLISGKTVGGMSLYGEHNLLNRIEALRLYTQGSAWFSNEETVKGSLEPGQFADLALLSDDYFTIAEDQIPALSSVLTMVDGKVVYASEELSSFGPPPLPVSPDWSPVAVYGGYYKQASFVDASRRTRHTTICSHSHASPFGPGLGCDCFAF